MLYVVTWKNRMCNIALILLSESRCALIKHVSELKDA
jgi:hypothetical protein